MLLTGGFAGEQSRGVEFLGALSRRLIGVAEHLLAGNDRIILPDETERLLDLARPAAGSLAENAALGPAAIRSWRPPNPSPRGARRAHDGRARRMDLVATRQGLDAELAVLDELTSGAWDLPTLDQEALRRSREVISRYREHEIGVADASIVVLAERYRTRTIAGLDRRHFDVLRSLDGGYFEVLPRVG